MSSRSVGGEGGKKTSCYWDDWLKKEPSSEHKAETETETLRLQGWFESESLNANLMKHSSSAGTESKAHFHKLSCSCRLKFKKKSAVNISVGRVVACSLEDRNMFLRNFLFPPVQRERIPNPSSEPSANPRI